MKHILNHWEDVARWLGSSRPIALFLDFDGTLARFRSKPDEARLDPGTRGVLAAVARIARFRVFIISGRRRSDVRARVRLPIARYCGLFGWEDRDGVRLSERSRSHLCAVREKLLEPLRRLPGVWVEDKEHALAVHVREAIGPVRLVAGELVRQALAPLHDALRFEPAPYSFEIMPRELGNKGTAVQRLMTTLPEGTIPVYIGDDLTDEPAFVALQHGITVHVGRSPQTRARFFVETPVGVQDVLKRLREVA